MLLPTKHLPTDRSALGSGARLLPVLRERLTVSEAWEQVSRSGTIATFDQFILGLDFLFMLGLVVYREGRLVRND
jgi:ABC-3C biological conflict system middle component